MTEQTTPPPSPTGTPLISAKLAPYLFAATTLCTLVAGASQMDLGLPKQVFGWAMIGAAFFGALLASTPGFRKGGVPVVLLCLGLGLASCQHAPRPLVITGHTLHAAKLGFVATEAGMRSANEQSLLTAAQRQAWNTFLPKFQKGFEAAVTLWEAARASADESLEQQAVAVITALLGELAVFTELLAAEPPRPAPTGREMPRELPDVVLAFGGAL